MADRADTDQVEDFDPGAPTESTESPDFARDVERANRGADGAGDIEGGLEAPAADFGHPGTLQLDASKALAFLKACMTSNPRVSYGLGAKVTPPGAAPGSGFMKVDCSGFVREAIRRSTTLGGMFPDGSVVQHDWVRDHDFRKVELDDGLATDGLVRIAFLRPQDSPQRIGHVVLLHKGMTMESHGGVGPDQRTWDKRGWQSKAHVYLLTR